jgi:hypothetical protein
MPAEEDVVRDATEEDHQAGAADGPDEAAPTRAGAAKVAAECHEQLSP